MTVELCFIELRSGLAAGLWISLGLCSSSVTACLGPGPASLLKGFPASALGDTVLSSSSPRYSGNPEASGGGEVKGWPKEPVDSSAECGEIMRTVLVVFDFFTDVSAVPFVQGSECIIGTSRLTCYFGINSAQRRYCRSGMISRAGSRGAAAERVRPGHDEILKKGSSWEQTMDKEPEGELSISLIPPIS